MVLFFSNSGGVNIVFMYIYCYENRNGISQELDKNKVLIYVISILNKWEKWTNFSMSHHKEKWKLIFVIFYFHYFRMLGIGRINKVFSPNISINI